MLSPLFVNTNGTIQRISNIHDAKVSAFDRSYLYGDSLYEVVRTYGGIPFHIKDHFDRLEKSALLARMTLPYPISKLKNATLETIQAFRAASPHQEAFCRLVLSRGVGPINFDESLIETPYPFTIFVHPLNPPTAAKFEKGYAMSIVKRFRNDPRALDPAMKSGNYLNSVLAYIEAKKDGLEDALLCNNEGFVTEGTTFNVFYVRRGIVATPPLSIGILDGVTRRLVIALAKKAGLEVRETFFTKDHLLQADEVFLSSTIKEVFPITRIDQTWIRGGHVGRITRKIAQLYRDEVTSGDHES